MSWSPRRIRIWAAASLAVLVCVPADAGVAAPAKEPFAWSLISRFGGDADGDGRLDADGSGLPHRLDNHPVLIEPVPAVCAAAAARRATWRVDGRLRELAVRPGATNGTCRGILALRAGSHRVEVDTGGGFRGARIAVKDRLVVALGDSVASGEGNPLSGPVSRTWLERPCHRSVAAGFEQAARLVAEGIRESSITLVSLACSGATVPKGLLGSYGGVEPRAGAEPLAPQVARLARLAQERPVDAVLVSIGANDVHFADVVRHCAAHPACPTAGFDPDARGGARRADEEVARALDALPRRYARLASSLRAVNELEPQNVLISEYFDPTHSQRGTFCRHSLPGVSRAEVQWAFDSLLQPLNREIAAAAAVHRWTLVGGIAADFGTHGYCAPGAERWVRTLGASAATHTGSPIGARLAGTLHPNERGHLAIADRVAPELARTLGFGLTKPKPPPAKDGGVPTWAKVGLIVLAVLGLFVLTGGRLWFLLRSAQRSDPVEVKALAPTLPKIKMPASVPQAVAAAAGTALTALVSVGFVALVGAAILWVRFWAARVPADQAVAEVARGEQVATGAQALIGFALLGIFAFLLTWLLDAGGQAGRATRRGLVLLIVLELFIVILIEDFSVRERAELIVGFVLGAVLLHFLLDRALFALPALRSGASLVAKTRAGMAPLWRTPHDPPERIPRWALYLYRTIPLAVLGAAIWVAATQDGNTRFAAVVAVVLAGALFVAPGGIGGGARRPTDLALEPVRFALASASLACLVVLLGRDEAWLAITAGVAAALAGGVLIVAGASRQRFAPYGIAVLASVPVFGAAAALLAAVNSPQLQPVAAVSRDGKMAFCGVYIAENDGRLWLARIDLAEAGNIRRPRARKSRLSSVDRHDLAASAVGPLQPVASALDQALILRDELLAQHDLKPTRQERSQSCAATQSPPRPLLGPQRTLAQRFQPELVIHRNDGFWPVALSTIFAMQDRRARTCRRSDIRGHDLCLRLSTARDLPWSGGEGEWIEYPAGNDRIGDQRNLMIDALGSEDPARSSRQYFLVTGGENDRRPVSVQYWFFYPFNYQPLGTPGKRFYAGFHEGDFESVGVVLSARTHRPRYLYMARHADEGRVFVWDEDAIERSGNHATIYAAQGSHADYESCAEKSRFQAKNGLIDDRPACKETQQLHLSPESTPLTDLSRTRWACWRGLFGHRREAGYERIPYLVADAPRSPLWQQHFDTDRADPCRGLESGRALGRRGEEVLPTATATRLRRRAGHLDALIDECADWERPPAEGAYLVACDQEALRRYVASGLEDPGPGGVRIDLATGGRVTPGPVTLPAVRRTVETRKLDPWRIAAVTPSTVTVFAACRQGDKGHAQQLMGRFPSVGLIPGRALHVDDRVRGSWRLRTEDGLEVARVAPRLASGKTPKSSVCG